MCTSRWVTIMQMISNAMAPCDCMTSICMHLSAVHKLVQMRGQPADSMMQVMSDNCHCEVNTIGRRIAVHGVQPSLAWT